MNGREEQQDADQELAQLQRALASVYKVERLLTRRGSTVVYQAAEINPPRPVALRIFPPELNLAPAAARFRELARVLVSLNHPNILQTYRIVFRAGVPYFVAMKLTEGRYLDEVLASQGALQLPLVLAALRGIAAALAAAHERGIIHGALTTGHVLLDREGHVLVEDFGIARGIEDAGPTAAAGTRVPSPEEAAGAAASAAGDQYALGIVALEMLTGTGQFGADPMASLREVRTARVALPDSLVKILQATLAQDPAKRFANAADLSAALQAIPFSDADLREATVVLGRLSRGEPVPKLRAVATPTGVTTARPIPAAPAPAPAPPVLELEATAPPAAPPRRPTPPAAAAPAAPPAEPARARTPSAPAMRAPVEPPVEAEEAPPAAPIMRASRARESVHAAPAAAAPARKRGSPLVWVLAAVVVVAAIGGGAYWLGRHSAAGPTAQAPAPTPGRAPAPAPAAPSTAAAPAVAAAESARADTTHRPAAAPPAAPAKAPAPAEAGAAGETTGLLLLSTEPPTADIYVDGDMAGSGGFLNADVKAGRRQIQVIAQGYETLDTTVTVRAGATVDLGKIALISAGAGRIRLRVSPPEAEIFVDGQKVGTGSVQDVEVAAGERHLTVSASGYQTYDTVITVRAGATLRIRPITLAPGGD